MLRNCFVNIFCRDLVIYCQRLLGSLLFSENFHFWGFDAVQEKDGMKVIFEICNMKMNVLLTVEN